MYNYFIIIRFSYQRKSIERHTGNVVKTKKYDYFVIIQYFGSFFKPPDPDPEDPHIWILKTAWYIQISRVR